ncbi:YceI family protein [Flavobacterium glaciei]|uniref:Polyisoprenoid-binding protein YceI n=1 Tax=Flavobacterium glaciei TaxID=386300 RepID=A0A562PHN9_9FLAO|nr:YceI family protein [Flavobacterium glaciei]RDI51332.1 polyisoprenoid-binding protein YceI [Flavobacterium glaciei]TWI43944.1 polyisoprenoid-binding protein YceI [Flavobacterium glaciei]
MNKLQTQRQRIMKTKWTVDSNQSDVLIKMRHSIIAYLAGSTNKFNGHIDIEDNEIEDASIEFYLDINNKDSKLEQIDTKLVLNDLFEINKFPVISFKSTSFEKVNKNINFLKGNLTIKNITKVVELDAEFTGFNTYDGNQKAAFEITGHINRKDFGLNYTSFNQTSGLAIGQDIKFMANLELTA